MDPGSADPAREAKPLVDGVSRSPRRVLGRALHLVVGFPPKVCQVRSVDFGRVDRDMVRTSLT